MKRPITKKIREKSRESNKGFVYKHLNKETNAIMTKEYRKTNEEIKVKIFWARMKHFIYYPKVIKILERLGWIYEQVKYLDPDDYAPDMRGLTIIGFTGVGKSFTLREFKKITLGVDKDWGHHSTYEGYPIQRCLLKSSITGLSGLYSALLDPYGHPYAKPDPERPIRIPIANLEQALINTMRESKTRIYFVDEFQHVKDSGRMKHPIINELKNTMLVAKVPFIPVGMPETEKIIGLDPQLEDRCPIRSYSRLKLLSLSNRNRAIEFQNFLQGYEKFLPLPEPSNLGHKDIAPLIFSRIKFPEGHKHQNKANLRNTAEFLKEATVNVLKSGAEKITKEIIKDTTY